MTQGTYLKVALLPKGPINLYNAKSKQISRVKAPMALVELPKLLTATQGNYLETHIQVHTSPGDGYVQ